MILLDRCDMLYGGLVFHGGEWPSHWEDEMTLIFALQGKDEIVVAADSMAHDGPDSNGRYKLDVLKLLSVHQYWLLGFSGAQDAFTIHKHIKAEGWESNLSNDIHLGACEYADKMRDLYEKLHCQGDTTALLCGVSKGEPASYTWSLRREKSNGPIEFRGPQIRGERAGIGAAQHGALYFASAFHHREMDTKQRILLAYFCVSEAAKHDLRVGGHVDIALIRENHAPRVLSRAELSNVAHASVEIANSIAVRFSAPGPSIPGL